MTTRYDDYRLLIELKEKLTKGETTLNYGLWEKLSREQPYKAGQFVLHFYKSSSYPSISRGSQIRDTRKTSHSARIVLRLNEDSIELKYATVIGEGQSVDERYEKVIGRFNEFAMKRFGIVNPVWRRP